MGSAWRALRLGSPRSVCNHLLAWRWSVGPCVRRQQGTRSPSAHFCRNSAPRMPSAFPCRCILPGAAGAAGGTVGLDLRRGPRRGCASAEAWRGNELIRFALQTQRPRNRHQNLREVGLEESREERKWAFRPKPPRKRKVLEGEGLRIQSE